MPTLLPSAHATHAAHRGPMPIADGDRRLRADLAIRIAESAVDRDRVFRLRHRIAARSFGHRGSRGRRASNGRLVARADASSLFLAAFTDDGEAVAALRTTPLEVFEDGGSGGLSAVRADLLRRGIRRSLAGITSTELMLQPSDDGHLRVRLMAALFKLARTRGWREDFVAVEPERRKTHLRLGYEDLGVGLVGEDGPPHRLLRLAFPSDTPAASGRRRFDLRRLRTGIRSRPGSGRERARP